MPDIDLKAAINAVSDVVQNRPRPLREFDQIYMKTGDMVMQSEFVSSWSDGKRVAFVGDGDSISVCVAYLFAREILGSRTAVTTVFDFDERVVNSVNRFAEREGVGELSAVLYNCFDAVPQPGEFDCFYTNPPWGATNKGESVNLFVRRGLEFIGYDGDGIIVIADDEELPWPKEVLRNVQRHAIDSGFYISRMMPRLHSYHLDDNPDLKSCNLIISAAPGAREAWTSEAVDNASRMAHFYGNGLFPTVKYIRDRAGRNHGKAMDLDYEFELLGGDEDA